MSNILRRELPLTLAAAIVLILFTDYYFQNDILRTTANTLVNWAVVASATAAGVGVLNVLIRTTRNIQKRESYWYLEIWMLIMMVVVAVGGVIGAYGTSILYTWVMQNIYLAIDSTIFSMVVFDITAAFYRTFRVRSIDAAILVISAFFVMIYNIPLMGGLFPDSIAIGSWVVNIASVGPTRALTAVTAIGLIGFAIRILLMKDKSIFGGVD